MEKKIVTFGEIMMRLTPQNGLRFIQSSNCDLFFGGSEANVAVALANYGFQSQFVSKVPLNAFGSAALNKLRQYGVDTSEIVLGGDRLGSYLLEKGYSPCANICTYDRAHSAFAEAGFQDFNWNKIFDNAEWFHFSGITPALSPTLADICLQACKTAQKKGITISCDINYRSKLWKMNQAQTIMQNLCRYVDVMIINEEEARVLGVKASANDLMAIEPFTNMANILIQRYPVKVIASAARIPASCGLGAKAMLWRKGCYQSPVFPLNIEDPVGAGDAFAAALIYGLLQDQDNQALINFATAACALKHSIKGDFNLASVEDIEKLATNNAASGVQR